MKENPEWLPKLTDRLAAWIRDAVDADELPWQTHKFILGTIKHGGVDVEIRLRRHRDDTEDLR